MGRLNGKVAVVTGAGSGIGRGCVLALAAEGAHIAITDVNDKNGNETLEMVRQQGGTARFYHLDVTSEAAWKDVFAAVKKDFGGLHVLVNNAGICITYSIFDMPIEVWRRQQSVNLEGPFFGVKHGVPLIAASGGGSVINISSTAGITGIAGLASYCATKGGLRLFSKAVALECAAAKNNVRVNSLHPGAIETPIWVKMGNGGDMPVADPKRNSDAYDDARTTAQTVVPLGPGIPADIAAGVVFLASDEARYITGTELVIDGGFTAA